MVSTLERFHCISHKNTQLRKTKLSIITQIEALEALPKQLLVGYEHECLEKFQANKINEYKIAGLKEQLKIPHVEDQESNISYYTKLQKQRVTQNNIFDIKDHHGTLHHTIEEKLKAFHHVNKILYTEDHPDEQVNARTDLCMQSNKNSKLHKN